MDASQSSQGSQGSPPRRRTLRIWWTAGAAWLALAVAASMVLWHLRQQAIDNQSRELGLLSLALTDEIDRGLQGVVAGLHAVRSEMREGRLPLTGADAARALRTRAELMPMVQTLWLVSRDGAVISASDATVVPVLTTFSPALDGLDDNAIAVSRPFVGSSALPTQSPHTTPTQTLVALAMRVDAAIASPSGGGWIFAAVPANTLLGAFTAALPAPDARMAVFRGDGVRLAGTNVGAATLDEVTMAQRLANRPTLEMRRFRDDTMNLVGLHSVPRYDIKVLVARRLDAVLSSWRGAAELTAAAFALLFVLTVASVHLVLRAEQRRSEAQRALQAQLARASKLESLGTLAGGVAHDFNNVLAGIVGFGEMAQDAAAPGSAQARHLDRVLQGALRGKALVERILTFSRGGARTSIIFELEPVVEEVMALLSASLRPGIVVERALSAGGARLRGDPTQAFEAVMNLCTNAMQAMQAMPEGGMVSVQLERVHVPAARILSHSALAVGSYVQLTVIDQGSGISAEAMEHLFEPFFTTRSAQSGTGLGLAVVHGVVAEFGGAIDVRSTPGRGARFTLYFPECNDEAHASMPVSGSVPGGAGQTLRVLDDDPALVALMQEVLTGLGYAPVVALGKR